MHQHGDFAIIYPLIYSLISYRVFTDRYGVGDKALIKQIKILFF